MSRYKMDDGTVVDTCRARNLWANATEWDGSNHISKATGTRWTYETLHESRKGRFYVERTSQWQGSLPVVEWMSDQEAVRWLLVNDKEVPERLAHLVDEVTE